ncbi:hypothetical protein GGR50DRAFT_635445 [Xylaria sp. CBS 124048]|nr:hypothetical protein GGR50DRAFT_635445 [Xylaria sp. CBS 124048]
MPPLRFVDQTDINNEERRLIRSHVMRGKNLGKTRKSKTKSIDRATRKSALKTPRTENARDDDNDLQISVKEASQRVRSFLDISRQVTGDPRFTSYTENISPQAVNLLGRMTTFILKTFTPSEFCGHTGVPERLWFELTFSNEAHFHCIVAIAVACGAFLTGSSDPSPVALYHMVQTYRLLNETLSGKEALADETIAIVNFTATYDRLSGDPQKAVVHVDGASRMIALRGGIRELAKRNFIVAEKAFMSDIELSQHFNTTPKFSSADIPRHFILIDTRDHHHNIGPHKPINPQLMSSPLYQSACPDLRDVILDILQISHLLKNQATSTPRLIPEAYHNTLIYACYRLLEVKPSSKSYHADASFNIVLHLAMIGFQNTFCYTVGGKLIEFALSTQRFRSTAQIISGGSKTREMVMLWALLMGRISFLRDEDDVWLVPKLKTFAENLGLHTWAEVSNALDPFPWVKKAMHEVRGAQFWNRTVCAV